ncbi:MAG: glycosyltransferase family 2 protein [candidate division KSB1 bacterium]|nr:glycosyltransferase family 2 protein [candidate division KSB1 bacterium]
MKLTYQRPSLSLCMIVKNEEHYLAGCLESVKDLVDEMVIVDTGSQDRTKEIAAHYGARLFDYTWDDNFSEARNESLRQATGDWILYLDAD